MGENKTHFDATFTDETIYFDESEANKDIVSIDYDRNIFTFKNTSDKAKQLKKGDIVLIHGKALGKADRITQQGSNIVVETVKATLDEAIDTGTIQWTTVCDFKPDMQLQAQIGDMIIAPTTRSLNAVNFNFDYGSYSYSIDMDMNKDNVIVKLEVTKKLGGGAIKAKFSAEGKVSAFKSENTIKYDKRKLKEYGVTNSNQQGELTLAITVAGSGNDAINLEMPVILGVYPVMVGPIPTVITLKMQIVVNAVVPMDGSAQISTAFKYNSETGFKYDGIKTEAKGRIGSYTITEKGVSQTGASSAIAANFGIGFPRIEVGLFGNVVVPWIQTAFLIGGDYTSFPACRTAKAQFIGGCGYDFSFLGIKRSDSMNLWQQEKVFLKVGDCR
ncbi:MAG: hypothetical protein LBC84_09910 [Prevotellaceae bacterium]|nr:hypothetical protein [Prevotellaceae bacterium]